MSACALGGRGGDVEEGLPGVGCFLQGIDAGCRRFSMRAYRGQRTGKRTGGAPLCPLAVTTDYPFAGCCGGAGLWRGEGPLCTGGAAWGPGADR